MSEELVGTGKALPRIRDATLIGGRRIRVTWKDQVVEDIDIMPALLSRRVFTRLRTDDALFQTMRIDEYGDALVWADGAELSATWISDLAPISLTNDEFRHAMEELKLNLDGMAWRLGIGRRIVAEYRKDKVIPPYIALATRHLVERQRRTG